MFSSHSLLLTNFFLPSINNQLLNLSIETFILRIAKKMLVLFILLISCLTASIFLFIFSNMKYVSFSFSYLGVVVLPLIVSSNSYKWDIFLFFFFNCASLFSRCCSPVNLGLRLFAWDYLIEIIGQTPVSFTGSWHTVILNFLEMEQTWVLWFFF